MIIDRSCTDLVVGAAGAASTQVPTVARGAAVRATRVSQPVLIQQFCRCEFDSGDKLHRAVSESSRSGGEALALAVLMLSGSRGGRGFTATKAGTFASFWFTSVPEQPAFSFKLRAVFVSTAGADR